MEPTLLYQQVPPVQALEPPSLVSSLEQGIRYARQQHHPEAMTAFTLAYNQLTSQHSDLASLLDALIGSRQRYEEAKQEVQEASKRLVAAESEQQQHLTTLEHLLPDLLRLLEESSLALDRLPNVSMGQHAPSQAPGSGLALPALEFTCFGHFQVKRLGRVVALCPNRKGQTILRYLVAKPGHRETLDKLIEILCRDDEPEVGRHKLEVALSALRCSLNRSYPCEPGSGYILYQHGAYQLNPAVAIRTDVEEFLELYQAGYRAGGDEAIIWYERACHLYTGPFLTEDLYADWTFIRREQLSQVYLAMCSTLAESALKRGHFEEALQWTTASLSENRCDETAHQQLIRAYLALGRRSEALRQYERCQQMLDEELGVQPLPETTKLVDDLFKSHHFSIQKEQ